MAMVLTSARIPVTIRMSMVLVGSHPTWSIATHFGIRPIGSEPAPDSGIQLKRPVKICWDTPATMKSPTPDPMPHLDMTSSMKRINTPPTQIWMRRRSVMTPRLTPNALATAADGSIYPPSTCGSAVNKIIAKTSIFCAPWKIA